VLRLGFTDARLELAGLPIVVRRVYDSRRATAAGDFGYGSGGWTLRRPATGVVLAGGRSSRMQRDKALLPLGGRPFIAHVVEQMRAHVDEILVSADDASKYAFLDLPVVPDRKPDQGPMMAIASTLERARNELVLYSPCDVPDLPASLVARLFRKARSGGDIIVPRYRQGRYEPLLALYRRSILPLVLSALETGERRIVRVYDRCDTRAVEVGPGEALRNINTAADYAALIGDSTK
jgi:molybdenum cofactor guanylyltransferase